MEVYIHINGNIDLKTMFPGYLFIKTKMNQLEFSSFILSLDEEKKGIIKELKKQDVSALSDDEIKLFEHLLDKKGILRMSEGFKQNGITRVISGPLIHFENCIVDTNKRDRIAVLNINFLGRSIKAGIKFKQNK